MSPIPVLVFIILFITLALAGGCVPGLTPPVRIPGNDHNNPNTTNSPSGVQNPVFIVNINTGGTVNQEIPNNGETQHQTTQPNQPTPEVKVIHPFPDKGDPDYELPPVTEEMRQRGQWD